MRDLPSDTIRTWCLAITLAVSKKIITCVKLFEAQDLTFCFCLRHWVQTLLLFTRRRGRTGGVCCWCVLSIVNSNLTSEPLVSPILQSPWCTMPRARLSFASLHPGWSAVARRGRRGIAADDRRRRHTPRPTRFGARA